jgi:hypothetical protein
LGDDKYDIEEHVGNVARENLDKGLKPEDL